jgi:putative glutamine amidotransferase
MPHSSDQEYAERAIPQYERAITVAGGEPVRIPLGSNSAETKRLAETCNAVLLPGSKADVEPAKFGQTRSPHTAAADTWREQTDFLLLEDAYAQRKPVLCICYGLQSLNVFRGGSLIQHIPDFLPQQLSSKVNHEAGRKMAIAHDVDIEVDSALGRIVHQAGQGQRAKVDGPLILPVNSSHHQSAENIGSELRVVARCPDDGIVEALEGTSKNHFVLAVQWHPERSVDEDDVSAAIFRALIGATR